MSRSEPQARAAPVRRDFHNPAGTWGDFIPELGPLKYSYVMAETSSPPELARLQLQQSVETYRVQLSLLVQICTVFAVADATVVGYSIQQRLAGVMWAGVVFPFCMLLLIRIIVGLSIPIVATAVHIEARYQDAGTHGLVSSFLAFSVSTEFVEELRTAMTSATERERARALGKLKPYLHGSGRRVRLTLMAVLVAQTVVPILLWKFAGWSLFAK
jgi:hypothetical protein